MEAKPNKLSGVGIEPMSFAFSPTGLATMPDACLFYEDRNNALHIKTCKIWGKNMNKYQKAGIKSTPLYIKALSCARFPLGWLFHAIHNWKQINIIQTQVIGQEKRHSPSSGRLLWRLVFVYLQNSQC